MIDYFKILGLPRRAAIDEEEIRRSFKNASRKVHPDAGGDSNEFARLNEAQSILLDPSRRLQHWVELEFPGEKSDAPLSPSLGALFEKTAKTLQTVSEFLLKRGEKASKLALALLAREEMELQNRLFSLNGEVLLELRSLEGQLPVLDSLRTGDPEAARLKATELSAQFRFLHRWQAQIQAKLGDFADFA